MHGSSKRLVFYTFDGRTGFRIHLPADRTSLSLEARSPEWSSLLTAASQISIAAVQPYNSSLTIHTILEHLGCAFMVVMRPYHACHRNLNVEHPTYTNLSHPISQTVSSITASLRFEEAQDIDSSRLTW